MIRRIPKGIMLLILQAHYVGFRVSEEGSFGVQDSFVGSFWGLGLGVQGLGFRV